MKEIEPTIKSDILFQLSRLRINAYSRFKINHRAKRIKKQKKISQLERAMLSGCIKRIK